MGSSKIKLKMTNKCTYYLIIIYYMYIIYYNYCYNYCDIYHSKQYVIKMKVNMTNN